jgi:integrase/recombinase XerD
VGINTTDISIAKTNDGDVTVLKLRGKGAKERLVPLGKFAVSAIEDYLIRTRPALAAKNSKAEPALFLNARGKRLSRQSAWQIVLDAAIATGLQGRVSPHVFRHSYATHLLRWRSGYQSGSGVVRAFIGNNDADIYADNYR